MGGGLSKDDADKIYVQKAKLAEQLQTIMQMNFRSFYGMQIIRISANTVLLGPPAFGSNVAAGILPSCIGPHDNMLVGFNGPVGMIDLIMSSENEMLMDGSLFISKGVALIKEINDRKFEGYRYRRRQDQEPTIDPTVNSMTNNELTQQISTILDQLAAIQMQMSNYQEKHTDWYGMQFNFLMRTLSGNVSASSERLVTLNLEMILEFVKKYSFAIDSFDSETGYPMISTIVRDPIMNDNPRYGMIVSDILRFNPTILRPCSFIRQ